MSGRGRGVQEERPTLPTDRITVSLVPKAASDLAAIHSRTTLSKTDIVNRALTLYDYIDDRLASGSELLIRNSETGETERIKLL